MPRRRAVRAHRAPSSDQIEEEGPTQRHEVDVTNAGGSDEEGQPSGKAKKFKAPRSNPTVPESGPDNGGDDDDDDGRIDIQNFRDQPLDKKEGAKLHGIAQDWEMIRKQIHHSSLSLVKDVAISLADVIEVGQASEPLDEVDAIMKELLDIDQEMLCHEQTLKDLHQNLLLGEVVNDVMDTYEKDVKRKINDFRRKTTRQKYASNDAYVQFKQGIFEVQNPGLAIPPINDLVPREDDDVSEEEDDLEIGGVTQDYKCPITLVTLTNPVTSSVCGHSYSAAAIQDYLRGADTGGRPCPAAGCNKRLTMTLVAPDKDLEKRVKIALRRRQQDEDSDEGEVVE
ncbi:hypothetical protein F5I97DRAFT_1884716 [Phlebopus sp. FC_14]|nr:hypothetical protein F5I97DRAFT_1884716 [Phlebopus sp. FC_14]